MSDLASSVVAVVPAYQAASTLSSVLSRLARHVPAERTLVVDDGSTDGTSDVGRSQGVHVVRQEPNRGKGAALRLGMRWWRAHPEWNLLATLDADGQHDPGDLPALYAAWEQSNADIVLGARRFAGVGMPWERQLSNRITSTLVTWRIGQRIDDSQCGFRLYHRRTVDSVMTTTDGFEAETEYLIRAAARGLSIVSAPVRTIYAGERSAMTYWKTTAAFVRTLLMEV